MKRSEARKVLKAKQAISWQPSKVGEFVQGKFLGFSPVGKGKRMGMLLKLEGCKPVNVGGVLKQVFSDPKNLALVRKAKMIKVIFDGTMESRKGNDTKLVSIFADKKKLEGTVGRIAGDEEVNKFFGGK